MKPISFYEDTLELNTIIDIVIPPYFKTSHLINKLIEDSYYCVILDFEGNLKKEFSKAVWSVGNENINSQSSISFDDEIEALFESDSKKIDFAYLSSFDEFNLKIESLKKRKKFFVDH